MSGDGMAGDAEAAKRRAVEKLAALMLEARTSGVDAVFGQGLRSPALAAVLAELRSLDPQMQRRAARALVESRGDPAALRAALESPAPDVQAEAATRRFGPRPPTVVDARGGVPWPAILAAAAAALLLVAYVSGAGGQ